MNAEHEELTLRQILIGLQNYTTGTKWVKKNPQWGLDIAEKAVEELFKKRGEYENRVQSSEES